MHVCVSIVAAALVFDWMVWQNMPMQEYALLYQHHADCSPCYCCVGTAVCCVLQCVLACCTVTAECSPYNAERSKECSEKV